MKKTLYFFMLCASSAVAQKNSVVTNSITCVPVASVCDPVTLDTSLSSLGIGITFVGLNQIQNPSVALTPILEEFTCTDSTTLNIAQPYAFEVHTGLDYEETVTAWIDFSNDGEFDEQEIVFHDSGKVFLHTGFITIPTGALNTFTPIRMRVGSDYTGTPMLNSCDDLLYGHYEDYKIFYGVNIGIGEHEPRVMSTLYPNPMRTSAKIEFGGDHNFTSGDLQLRIFNCFGQLSFTKIVNAGNEVTFERGTLASGLYLYELTNSLFEKTTGKFLID